MLALLLLVPSRAQWNDPLIALGFDHFYNVEYAESIAAFQKAVEAEPLDAHRHNYLAQATLFSLMYKAGALESEFATGNNPFLRRPKMNPTPEEEARFHQAVDAAISLSKERLLRNPNNADALYTQGVALALRGNYNFLVRKAWLEALRDLTAGRRLHNRVTELDPARVDARLLQGVHDYVVGSLPWGYKMLGFLTGIRGDRVEGIRTLQLVARKGHVNRSDAEILLAVVYRREKRAAEAIPLCQDLLKRYPRNFLVLFELSQLYADLGNKANALAPLDRIEQLKASGAPGFRNVLPERIAFARGNLLFWYDDIERAVENLRRAAARSGELDPNTGVLSLLRLGQCYDLLGRRSEAQAAYRQAIAYAPESEPAREARRYLSSLYRRPNKT